MADRSKIPVPKPTPETEDFWQGAKAGELRMQRCSDCQEVYFPPRPFCPVCASKAIKSFRASGRATLHSYVINHRDHPAFDGPYSIAVVQLEEGPRMMTNIINVEQTPEALELDMPLEVVFEPLTDTISLPYFQPAQSPLNKPKEKRR